MGDILKKFMTWFGNGEKGDGAKTTEQSEKSASEKALERIHQYEKQPTATNGSFIMKYQTEPGSKENDNNNDPIEVLNYINALKWLVERNFWVTTKNDAHNNLLHREEDKIYFSGTFGGRILYKTPWSETPIEMTVYIQQQNYFDDGEYHRGNFITKWSAYTYLTYLFDNVAGRDDLKDTPLQNNDIYKMFIGTDKWGQAVALSKIESTWHNTPEKAMLYIFGKLDEIVPKMEQLASYQKDFENAMEKKANALNEIGIRSLDERNSEKGWREEKQ